MGAGSTRASVSSLHWTPRPTLHVPRYFDSASHITPQQTEDEARMEMAQREQEQGGRQELHVGGRAA